MALRFGQTGFTKAKMWMGINYVIFVSIISALALLFYGNEKEAIEDEINKNLSTIARLKVIQLSNWYVDEIHDAYIISHNKFFYGNIDRWLQTGTPSDRENLRLFLVKIVNEHDYEAIMIIDQEGKLLVSSDHSIKQADSTLIDFSLKSIRSDSTLSTNLYSSLPDEKKHLSFISPVKLKTKTIAVIFTMSPDKFIYPLLSHWPVPSQTAENLLVRNDAGHVVFLNESRHIGKNLFQIKLPADDSGSPFTNVISAKTGAVKGTDYRGKEVFAWIDKVRHTDWFLVSKIDQDELAGELNKVAVFTMVFSLLIILLIGFGLILFYNLQQKNYYRNLWKMQEEHKTTLYSIGDGVITTDRQGMIRQMNPVAEKLTGWSEKEARNKTLEQVFCIVNEETGKMVESPVEKVLRSGAVVGLANHTLLISKEGNKVPIADSGAPIHDEHGIIDGVVLVFRDQTEERLHQKALEESQRKLSTLMANLPGMAYSCRNDVDWTMLFVSEGCIGLTGFLPDELINNKLIAYGELIVPSFRQMVEQEVQKAIENRTFFQLEYQIRSRDGSLRWVWEQGRGIFDQNDHLLALEGFITDITTRKHAEQEKLRFANILEASMNELYMFDAGTYRFVYANQGALHNLGYRQSELQGLSPIDIQPYISIEQFNQMVAPLVNGLQEKIDFETIHKRKDGSDYPVEVHLQLLEQKDKGLYLAVAIDITERKKNEAALKQSEEEYRNLFENHSAVKFLINPIDGRIANANRAAEQYYGWTKEQLLTMRITDIDIISKKELKEVIAFATGQVKNQFEFQHRLADGQIRDVEVFTSLVEFRGQQMVHAIVHDITERKVAERKIQLLSRSIEQSPVCVVITDMMGQIEYVNNEFTDVTGYRLEEVLGKNPRILQSGYHGHTFYKEMWETILSGENWHGEMYNKKKDGGYFWESANIVPIINEDNEITHFVALKEDITEKKKLFEELISAKQRAEESDRLKSAFLANMSHEIRTPLNSILGFTNFLTSNHDLSLKEKETYTEIINKSADGLLQIINDILDISRLETGQVKVVKRPFDLNVTLNQILKQAGIRQERIKKQEIEIQLRPYPLETEINQDEYKIIQIFLNLINNALKFTSKGLVSFGVEHYDQEKIGFFVSDTGIGIKAEDQKAIFERFRQLDDTITRTLGGNGLGLAIVKNLVELLGGQISLESEYGKGTIFRFTLPV